MFYKLLYIARRETDKIRQFNRRIANVQILIYCNIITSCSLTDHRCHYNTPTPFTLLRYRIGNPQQSIFSLHLYGNFRHGISPSATITRLDRGRLSSILSATHSGPLNAWQDDIPYKYKVCRVFQRYVFPVVPFVFYRLLIHGNCP